MSQIYRQTRLGISLTDTLDDMQKQGLISPQMAEKVSGTFDNVFIKKLQSSLKTSASIKGHLRVYRYCSDVWTFVFENPTIKLEGEFINADFVRIVAIDHEKIGSKMDQDADASNVDPRQEKETVEKYLSTSINEFDMETDMRQGLKEALKRTDSY